MVEKAPISVCIIVKNEPLLENCVKSIRDYVKEIVIVDTGSTDNTIVVANSLADIFEIYTDCNNLETGLIEDFSKARQRSFELASQPWVMWVDADDVIVGSENLLKLISNVNTTDTAVSFMFPYEYSYNELDQCTCVHYRERLVSNKNKFHWINPVHEVLVANENVQCTYITDDSIIYKHKRQYSNKPIEPGRNLRILRNYIAKIGDSDARQLYYLGLECYNNNLIEEAIQNLTKYVEVSGWDDERAMACLKLVDIFQVICKYNEGLKWAFKTIEIKETWGEGYFALAKMFYFLAGQGGVSEMRNWERCIHFSRIGLSLPITKTLLFVNPLEREYDIHRYLNIALSKLGDVKGALSSVNIGLQSKPNDQSLLINKKIYETWILKQDAFTIIDRLNSLEEITPKIADLIKASLNKSPENLETFVIQKSNNEFINFTETTMKNPLNIIFFAGDGVETWTPETVKRTGIGGSETMLIEQAKRLSALGHNVSVYNSCGIFGSKIYDGVHYYQTNKFKNLECDVLIVSRRADMLSDQYNITAKLKLLWVHDICAINATNALLLKADRILALTEWHKENLIKTHHIHPDHVIVTRNGIDLNLFSKNINRNKFKCINSSSPDRSWPILLEIWPQIKAQIPEAELHLYYGFKNWEFAAQFDQLQLDLIERIKNKIKELEPLGVVYHDRVSKEVLAEEFLSAGCWIHPTWFTETSCITAMEAQAAGLGIVTSSIAALNETVNNRGILINGDWTSPEYKNKFIQSVIEIINNYNDLDRIKLQEYANQNFGLDSLAQNWSDMFYQLIDEIKINPMIPYQPTIPYRKNGTGYYDGDTRLPENNPERRKVVNQENIKTTLPRLNIGSGPNVFPFEGWINYDREDIGNYLKYLDWQNEEKTQAYKLEEMPEHQQILANFIRSKGMIDFRVHDIRTGFSHHADSSIESIYIGQVIEHLNPIYEVPKLLSDCYRMLKPGGVIRLTTPDLDLLIKAYLNNDMDKFAIEQPEFYKSTDPSSKLAMIMYGASGPGCTWTNYDGHMFLYTQTSMTAALSAAGFKNIEFYYESGQGKDPIMTSQVVDAGMTHSFIVEGVK
jgi:glycosyltransferase involved in cell wall biosynthesis/SAM-dependent methyltransferase